MLLRMLNYEVQLKYCPGKNIKLADTLSDAYLPNKQQSNFESTVKTINMLQCLPVASNVYRTCAFSIKRQRMLLSLQKLGSTIRNGWPNDRKSILALISPYNDIRDNLSIQNKDIFKGDRVVLPQARELTHPSLELKDVSNEPLQESIYWSQ